MEREMRLAIEELEERIAPQIEVLTFSLTENSGDDTTFQEDFDGDSGDNTTITESTSETEITFDGQSESSPVG